MSYSMCRFWAYDESKNFLGAGKDAPAWKLVTAGSMGSYFFISFSFSVLKIIYAAGGIAGLVGNPGGVFVTLIARVIVSNFGTTEIVMVRLQGDFAKPPEKRFNYKNCFDALFRVRLSYPIHFPLPRYDVTRCAI